MTHRITLLPAQQNMEAPDGADLLCVLRDAGFGPDAPCGGAGKCGKCTVEVDGKRVLACRTPVDRDMTVRIPEKAAGQILTRGIGDTGTVNPLREGFLLAFDIGTTTVVGYLLNGKNGEELGCESMRNPQAVFGADVISRIQHALQGYREELTNQIRGCAAQLTRSLLEKAGVASGELGVVALVGNPAMQQLFLGISPENLARIPFDPVLKQAQWVEAGDYLPEWGNALLLIVPDISGFVGADTAACMLAAALDREEKMTLLVDIGTNGEMVLGNRQRMVACAAAAGPALEGANIRFGMGGQPGAIDHVWLENGEIRYSVIGGGKAAGICGSGLIDAVAAGLELGCINGRGRILNPERELPLGEGIFLTQEDIRQVQMAKGAIAAGIHIMAAQLGIRLEDIEQVYLAGAFGTYMDPRRACRIGLLPPVLEEKIRAVGNAAGSGAKLLCCNGEELQRLQTMVERTEFIELASAPGFQRVFAQCMRF